jgi:hypothetical protein
VKKRDPAYVIRAFESLIQELRGVDSEVKVPLGLAVEILPLLKRAVRDRRGAPPKRTEHDREVDRVVVGRARRRFSKLRKANATLSSSASRITNSPIKSFRQNVTVASGNVRHCTLRSEAGAVDGTTGSWTPGVPRGTWYT